MKKNKSNAAPPTPESVIHARIVRLNRRAETRALLVKILLIALALTLVFHFLFGVTVSGGESMFPRIRDGDLVFYFRVGNTYAIGDVVVYPYREKNRISRIVAQGGDVVLLDERGDLYVNGNIQAEEIYYDTFPEEKGITYPYTVPPGCYFVLGDFRTGSTDSRLFGAVAQEALIGKVFTIIRRRGI